jgi:hypothetical protein
MGQSNTVGRDLPRVMGARRLLASGRLGEEMVRLAEAAAEMDREEAARLAEASEPAVQLGSLHAAGRRGVR